MISVLAEKLLLGAALGCAFTGIVVFEQRKRIHESISDYQSQAAFQSPSFPICILNTDTCSVCQAGKVGRCENETCSEKCRSLVLYFVLGEDKRKWLSSPSFWKFLMKEPIFGKKSRSEFALLWNETVDQVFVPVIEAISSRIC